MSLDRVYEALGSKYWSWSFGRGHAPPGTLLELLLRELPHIPADSWPERFAWGGVYVNGRGVRRDIGLTAPCRVEYYEPKEGLAAAEKGFPPFDPEKHIVHEDDHLLAVFKPAGLPCLPQRDQRGHNLCACLERHLRGRIHMPSRLDHSCAGLVLVSRSLDTHACLQRAFEERLVSKCYLLEAAGAPDWRKTVADAPLERDPRHPVLRRIAAPGAGKPARTEFRVLGRRAGEAPVSLIEARPVTGRTHQIRVHIASLGMPIVGDNFYDGPRAPELRLLSFRLRLQHPVTEERLDIRLPERLFPDWLRGWGFLFLANYRKPTVS